MELLQQEHVLARSQCRAHKHISVLTTFFYQKWVKFLKERAQHTSKQGRTRYKGKRKEVVNHPCNQIEVNKHGIVLLLWCQASNATLPIYIYRTIPVTFHPLSFQWIWVIPTGFFLWVDYLLFIFHCAYYDQVMHFNHRLLTSLRSPSPVMTLMAAVYMYMRTYSQTCGMVMN